MADDPLKLKKLESFLDKGGSPQALPIKDESEIVGWSPHTSVKKNVQDGMANLSLGPTAEEGLEAKSKKKGKLPRKSNSASQASEGASNDAKELSKAERKALFEKERAAKGGNLPKKEKLSKAERRALQEKQRAAKEATKKEGGEKKAGDSLAGNKSGQSQGSRNQKEDAVNKTSLSGTERKRRGSVDNMGDVSAGVEASAEQDEQSDSNVVELFAHLPQFVPASQVSILAKKAPIHPAIHALGLKYAMGSIRGSNGRCIAMLEAFKEFVMDYRTPGDKALSWDLDKRLRPQIQFLIDIRPLSISMGNAIKYVRHVVAKVPPDQPEAEAKEGICDAMDAFIQERIVFAGKAIADYAALKVADGDVILTYGRSEAMSNVVEELLLGCRRQGRRFRVIVADARPDLEGRATVQRLSRAGVPCTYVLLPSLAYVMPEVTKVFLGAAALLSNGAVGARVGTANVAMTAHRMKKPVMICCETYKFCDKVSLDSICSNELGDPEALATTPALKDWGKLPKLKVLNLLFDLTPIEYVSMVITEVGMIPPTSAPVLLREYRKEPVVLWGEGKCLLLVAQSKKWWSCSPILLSSFTCCYYWFLCNQN